MAKTLASVWASVHDPGGTRPTRATEIVEAGSREVVALAWPFRDVRQEIPSLAAAECCFSARLCLNISR